MNRAKKQKTIIAALLVLNLIFIWGNSMLNGSDSAKVSDIITGTVEKVILSIKPNEAGESGEVSESDGVKLETNDTLLSEEHPMTEASDSFESNNDTESISEEKSDAEIYFEYILSIVVRKCAHILEFCLLAVWLMLLLGERVHMVLLCGVFTALIDETIQLYSGRSSLVMDVWIDIGGFALGILAAWLIGYIKKKKASERESQ